MATSSAGHTRHLPEHFAVPWKFGGSQQRIALLAFVILYVSIPLGLATLILSHLPFSVGMSYMLVVISYPSIMYSTVAPLYSDSVLREALRRGWWKNTTYYEELARFLEAHGERGLAPGIFRWALLNWGIYYIMGGVAVLFSLTLLGVLGVWTFWVFAALNCSVFLSLYALNSRRVKALYREAERYGFRLGELSPFLQRFRARQVKPAEREASRSSMKPE